MVWAESSLIRCERQYIEWFLSVTDTSKGTLLTVLRSTYLPVSSAYKVQVFFSKLSELCVGSLKFQQERESNTQLLLNHCLVHVTPTDSHSQLHVTTAVTPPHRRTLTTAQCHHPTDTHSPPQCHHPTDHTYHCSVTTPTPIPHAHAHTTHTQLLWPPRLSV